jgi:hypothetical protein
VGKGQLSKIGAALARALDADTMMRMERTSGFCQRMRSVTPARVGGLGDRCHDDAIRPTRVCRNGGEDMPTNLIHRITFVALAVLAPTQRDGLLPGVGAAQRDT